MLSNVWDCPFGSWASSLFPVLLAFIFELKVLATMLLCCCRLVWDSTMLNDLILMWFCLVFLFVILLWFTTLLHPFLDFLAQTGLGQAFASPIPPLSPLNSQPHRFWKVLC
jgi:hypothetical protein